MLSWNCFHRGSSSLSFDGAPTNANASSEEEAEDELTDARSANRAVERVNRFMVEAVTKRVDLTRVESGS